MAIKGFTKPDDKPARGFFDLDEPNPITPEEIGKALRHKKQTIMDKILRREPELTAASQRLLHDINRLQNEDLTQMQMSKLAASIRFRIRREPVAAAMIGLSLSNEDHQRDALARMAGSDPVRYAR